MVSDVIPMFESVGGVVVVGRLGMTTYESLRELRDQLENLDAPLLGVVVNSDLTNPVPRSTRTGLRRVELAKPDAFAATSGR